MAVGTGIGVDLDALKNAIKAADKGLEDLISNSKKAKSSVIQTFLDISTQGVEPFLNKLGQQKEVFEALSKVSLEGVSDELKNIVKETSSALDQTNQLITVYTELDKALAPIQEKRKAIAESEKDTSLLQKWLEEKDKEAQKNEEVEREKHNQILKNIGEQSAAYQKAENERYEAWQENNAKKKREEEAAEDAKWQKQKNTIYKQNKQFEAEKKEQAKQQAEEEKRNAKLASDERINAVIREARKRLEIERVILAAQKKAHDQRQKELEQMFREQEMQAKQQAKYDSKSRKERYESYTTSYEGAIRTSNKANTLAKEMQAVKNLEAARSKLNKTDAEYEKKLANINNRIKKHNENIDKATRGTKKLREEHQALGQTAGGLGRMLASVFSIQAIRGYINQLIKVRGEMEMQQRALQAILQNKDEADAIWQKTIELAVRSPFRIKELVTYTKQLAAYRVEADKLYDTNKMLADVSSGLGVDMSRLILAFGQVKAANYLRGTELRQFSEAGINMLGELSKYFTELEGRAVSVGDVFERISKRMVSFSDVEEIFKRITSEGGTFYRMQEIQAETLKGQISNLKDSIDIMLNEMGKANDSTLRTMVSLTKSVVDNWRTISAIVIPIMGALITRWGLFRIVTTKNVDAIAGFAKTFGRHFGIVITQLTRGTRVAKQFAKSTGVSIMSGWTTVILAVVAALAVLIKTIQNANRVKKELETLELGGAFDASRSVAEYKKLANVVADTSKSYDEQQKALTTLKTKYADILPSHLLEAKTIKSLAGNYEEAKNAIYDYVAAKTKEKQIGVIQSEYGQDVQDQASDLADDIRKALAKVAPNITRSDVLPIVNKLQELIEIGDVDVSNVDATIQNLVKEFTGLSISTNAWKYTMRGADGEMLLLEDNAFSLVKAIKTLKTEIDNITSSSLNWMDSFVYQDFNKVKEGYEAQANAIGKYYDTIRKYQEQQQNGVKAGEIAVEESEVDAATDALNKIFTDANSEAPKWNEIINEPFKLNEATITANKLLWAQMIDDINNMPVLPSQTGAKQNYVEALEQQMKGFDGTAKQQEVARIAQELATSMEVSLKGLDDLFLKSDESISDYAKRISGTLDQYKKGIKEFDKDVAKGVKLGDYTKEQVDLMRAQVPFLEEFLKYFEAFLDPKTGSTTDTFSPMLRSVKEIYDEFKKLKATFDEVTAKEGAIAKFGDAFKEAFGKTPEEMGFDLFSEDGVKAAYDYLISKAPDAKARMQAKLAKGEITWDVNLKTKKDADKKLLDDIQNMFDQYDLSLELKKLNIPPDLAKSLFGIESINLSDIREKVQREIDSAKAVGGQDDRVAQLEKDLEKINDMEDKAAKERMKTYVKYLMEGMSERVKLKIEELRKLKEIEESDEFSPEQKERIKEGVSKEARAEQQKQEWKDFQGTEMYTMMFEDLEHYGTAAIDALYDKLSQLKTSLSDLPASEVKEIVGQIEKLENIKIERNPFESLKTYKDVVKNIGFTEDELQTQLLDSQKAEEEAQKYIDIYNTVMQSLMSEDEGVFEQIDAETLAQWNEMLRLAEEQGKTVEEILADRKATVKTEQDNQGKIVKNLNSYKKLDKSQEAALKKTEVWLNAVGDVFSASKELMTALGVESDSVAMTIADTGSSMISLILSAVQFTAQLHAMGIAANSALGIIGWVAIAIQAVAMAIAAIFSAKDKALQKQVEDNLSTVEELQKRYDALEDSIDNAWDTASIREYNRELKTTTQAMINAQKAAIAAQSQRKRANKEGSDAYNELQDMKAELKELEAQLEESLADSFSKVTDGILDSVHDAAKEFTDAWWDAFVETGDGLSGLEENFNEMFLNLAKNQAAMQITGAFAEMWKKDLEKYINADDTELTKDEAREWAEKVRRTMPELSNALEAFLGTIYESVGGLQSGELSSLQKGIQGITEDTAQIIEAYLNSIRGYVSEQVTHTRNIYNILKQATVSDAAAIRVRMVE